MKNPQPLRCVLIDAAGTLIHPAEPVGKTYAMHAGKFGVRCDPDAAEQSFREVFLATPAPGKRNDEDFGWWRDVVLEVFERTGTRFASESDREGCFRALFDHYAEGDAWSLFPEVPAFLSRVTAAGLRPAVVSNFDKRLVSVLDGLALLDQFAGVFYSSALGTPKPDPALFHHALRELGESPEAAFHVGDEPEADGAGAAAAGIAGHFVINRRNQTLDDAWEAIEKLL